MSWLDKIETDLTITTGDGAAYTPTWLNANKLKEYNVATFEFRNLDGTLVVRGNPKGARYGLEVYFQGEDHLDVADRFEVSADNRSPWNLSHPFYGSITVQPLSLQRDNSALNVSKFIIPVIETITEDAPKTATAPQDVMADRKALTDETLAQTYAYEVPAPAVADRTAMRTGVGKLYDEGKKYVKSNLDFEEYFNAFNAANSAIDAATQDPLEAMRAIQRVINAPAFFADSVRNRLNMLSAQWAQLRTLFRADADKNTKTLYGNNGAALVGAMAQASATGVTGTDYRNRADALSVLDTVLDTYNQYIADVDGLQSDTGGTPESYFPNADALTQLAGLITATVNYLYNAATDARQERVVTLPEDSDLFNVAFKYYGLDADDSTLDELMNVNGLGKVHLFELKKGQRIIYYV